MPHSSSQSGEDPLANFFSTSVVEKNNHIIATLKKMLPEEICDLLPKIIKDERCHFKLEHASVLTLIFREIQTLLSEEAITKIIGTIYPKESQQELKTLIGSLNAWGFPGITLEKITPHQSPKSQPAQPRAQQTSSAPTQEEPDAKKQRTV